VEAALDVRFGSKADFSAKNVVCALRLKADIQRMGLHWFLAERPGKTNIVCKTNCKTIRKNFAD
jgi:hypothetical protein